MGKDPGRRTPTGGRGGGTPVRSARRLSYLITGPVYLSQLALRFAMYSARAAW